jgi:murein DD-endopeptidase MepM/ murein hydrolase activator NlpD
MYTVWSLVWILLTKIYGRQVPVAILLIRKLMPSNSVALLSGEALTKIDFLSRQLVLQEQITGYHTVAGKEQNRYACFYPQRKTGKGRQAPETIGYTSGFGYRIHPVYKIRKFHAGLDFPARVGDGKRLMFVSS